MKKAAIFLILIFFSAGVFVSCDSDWGLDDGGGDEVVIDPCQETPNCIPDVSDWKLHYKPYNSDCTKCHTTCTPNAAHTFCTVGESWNVTDNKCLECHPNEHQ